MKFARIAKLLCAAGSGLALAACATVETRGPNPQVADGDALDAPREAGVANPGIWPAYEYPVEVPAAEQARIDSLLARMTLEEKVGQLVQADLCCVSPEDAKAYNLGSILVGGNSGPYGDDLAPAPEWLKAADDFYNASIDTSDGGVGIPIVWGVDAVHGHSNIIGATIFPHNIGLGAMRDPELIERIGAITAREIRATGQEWTFAPTVAVPQDFRWGRAYEGYSSDPQLVASYVGAMVRGLQGEPDNWNMLAGDKVIASTKHFLADGGTDDGVDQGDSSISEEELRDIHGLPYGPAISEGVSTVMVSFSSWQGKKMTGNKSLVTDVLKDRMDFEGFVVSDWNAHGQVADCTNDSCPQALLAGIDMYMAPDTWKAIYTDTLAKARSGEIPMERIDEAVAAILRVKARLGLFEAGAPSTRPLSGEFDLLGAPAHREVAREAVRKSLVLLKNDGVLPIAPGGRLLVAGEGADDIARQSGGWTLSWQGTGHDNSQFPGATSLFAGLKSAVEAGGGSAVHSPDGSFEQRPDAAVVVFGEKPYAEFQGDRATLMLDADLTGPYATMERLKAQGIPVVAVMITGRPLYVNPALNRADAFVVAWLPGSEGAGLADVVVAGADGAPRYDFTGKLPTAWPATGSLDDGALFDFGYGLTYASPATAWETLAELDKAEAGDSRTWFANGVPAASWSLLVNDEGEIDQTRITTVPAGALGGRMRVTAANYIVQEGARRFEIASGDANVVLHNFDAVDLSREAAGDVMLLVTMQVTDPADSFALAVQGGRTQATIPLDIPASAGFVRYGIPLRCLAGAGIDMSQLTTIMLQTSGAADYALAEVRVGNDAETVQACPAS
ncbi:glycoside hydrolase family 3 N-terminal domain-containing protein [Alteriqipengyuania flavescens]|uniref:glycoside hydrolase family 3 protein n=1 Tax=Alteriqipengyuania flavescens TaxID=3053610 RepID=UPI0025B36453|nr:glycoside hydrolase family 3 protein [Alteriqipengyuania flavescens]WJY19693.1 glycoside hydrolase family 3 N-terminal domain-containing protein [Alteriqipengyuania flavescens]WJY25633.1 glycoside hydrolase family 3 N-terminal domain-containing protein [Alteriqipengyuania flavescens]